MLDKIKSWFSSEPPALAGNAEHAKGLADAFQLAEYMRETMEMIPRIRSQIHRVASVGGYHLHYEGKLPEPVAEALKADGYKLEEILQPSEAVYEFSNKQPRLEGWTKIKWGKDA